MFEELLVFEQTIQLLGLLITHWLFIANHATEHCLSLIYTRRVFLSFTNSQFCGGICNLKHRQTRHFKFWKFNFPHESIFGGMLGSVQYMSSYLLSKNGLLIKQVLQKVPLFFQNQEIAVLEQVYLPWKPTELLSCKIAAQLSKTFGLKFFGGKISAPLFNFHLQFGMNR